MAQQTAVEWLINELGEYFPDYIGGIELLVKQAKAMEKEQIMNTFADGFVEGIKTQKSGEQLLFPEQYYNETYNK